MDGQRVGLLEVAAVEVLSNVVRHAKGLGAQASMELVSLAGHSDLTLLFHYAGEPYTPQQPIGSHWMDATDQWPHNLPENGFGLSLIHKIADKVEYRHQDGINTVSLHIKC